MTMVAPETLEGLVTNALERMAFVFTEHSAATVGEFLAEAAAHALVELRGTEGYVVMVSATPGMVQEIASGMMGVEPHEIDVDEHGRATVAEMANVLGGELVMRFDEHQNGLLIGLPREVADEEAGRICDGVADRRGCTCIVESDDGQLMVVVVPS